jgi:hypothetical protein
MNSNQIFYFILLALNAIIAVLTNSTLERTVALIFVAIFAAAISTEREKDES